MTGPILGPKMRRTNHGMLRSAVRLPVSPSAEALREAQQEHPAPPPPAAPESPAVVIVADTDADAATTETSAEPEKDAPLSASAYAEVSAAAEALAVERAALAQKEVEIEEKARLAAIEARPSLRQRSPNNDPFTERGRPTAICSGQSKRARSKRK